MEDYFKIGKLAASTGLIGEIILEHSLGKATDLAGLQAVFIEDKAGKFIPYFLESAKKRTATETIIKLEGVDIVEQARKITPKEAWFTAKDFQKFRDKAAPISLLGYSVIDQGENLGPVIEVIEQPHQVLCAIMYKGKEALIPVHQDNLKKIDHKKKEVTLDIPEGLLEIYL